MPPRLKKLLGAIVLIGFVGVYLLLAAALATSNRLTEAHWLVQLVFFAIGGTLWVLPARAIIAWMERH